MDNGRRGNPGSRFLSNALFRKREAQAFPPKPSEECGAGALARELSPSPPQPGYSQRPRQSETQLNYIEREPLGLPRAQFLSQQAAEFIHRLW